MRINYKNYELCLTEDGDVDCILLNGHEVGVDDCPEMNRPPSSDTILDNTLESAIEWINEDIKCRADEEEDVERYYLEEGDELFCDGVDAVVGKNDILCFNGYRDDTHYYYDGYDVEFDNDGKPYIER